MSTKEFYDVVRPLFDGRLTQNQVNGIEIILEATDELPKSFRAYLLATTFHETAKTMQPINEYGGNAYFHKMYDIKGRRPHKAKELGNIYPGDGIKFHGRGYVQLTGRTNYKRATNKLKHNFIRNPDLALDPNLAAQILREGCLEGWFTGKKLEDYLPGDYKNARKIVNGLDKARTIARYAVIFEEALNYLPAEKAWWQRFGWWL